VGLWCVSGGVGEHSPSVPARYAQRVTCPRYSDDSLDHCPTRLETRGPPERPSFAWISSSTIVVDIDTEKIVKSIGARA